MAGNVGTVRVTSLFNGAPAIKDMKAFGKMVAKEVGAIQQQIEKTAVGSSEGGFLGGLKKMASGAIEVVVGTTKAIMTGIATASAGIIEGITVAVGKTASTLLKSLSKTIGSTLSSAGSAVMSTLGGAGKAVLGVLTGVAATAGAAFGAILPIVGGIASGIAGAVTGVLGAVVSGVGSILSGVADVFGSILGAVGGLASSLFGFIGDAFSKLMESLAIFGLAVEGAKAAWNIFSTPLKGYMDLEKTLIGFKTLLGGSAEAADALLKKVNQFALETDFQTPELAAVTKQLLAYGVAADDILPNLKMLGEISSGLGINLSELADKWGKLKVSQFATTQDFNEWMSRGVNIAPSIAKQFGIATTEVKKFFETGRVEFKHIDQALNELAGTTFKGGLLAASQSLSGLWGSTLDSMNMKMIDFAGRVSEAFDFKGMLSGFNEAIESIGPYIDDLVESIELFASGPMWAEMKAVATAAFGAIKEMGASAFEAFKEGWQMMGLPTIKDLKSQIINALLAAEYGFKNWQLVAAQAFDLVKFNSYGLWRTFTEDGPKAMQYLGQVVGTVFDGIIDSVSGFADYLVEVMKALAQQSPLLAGDAIKAITPEKYKYFSEMIPGTEEFRMPIPGANLNPANMMGKTVAEVAKIPVPSFGTVEGGLDPYQEGLNKRIEDRKQQIGQGFTPFKEKREEELFGTDIFKFAPENLIPELFGKGQDVLTPIVGQVQQFISSLGKPADKAATDLSLDGGADVNSKEGRDALVRHQLRGINSPPKDEAADKTADNTADIASLMKRLVEIVEGGGSLGGFANSLGLS